MTKLLVNGRRSAIEIIYEMLMVCRAGANKTAVMYRSNLSHDQLVRYLGFLETQGLIHRNDQGRYLLTQQGDETLKQIEAVIRVLGDLGAE